MRLKDKVVVITGAGSGTGKAMVEVFCSEGASVVAADWDNTSLDLVVSSIQSNGGSVVGIQCDVSNFGSYGCILSRTGSSRRLGHYDTLLRGTQ
jgi:NAD(P)-dependent dehydrogenase (short-subunit alcohol dehydrogenase family)